MKWAQILVDVTRGVALIFAMTVAPAPAAQALADTKAGGTNAHLMVGCRISVSVNSPMADVFVGDDAIVDIRVRSSRQLDMVGKAPGETTAYVTNDGGSIIYSAVVHVAARSRNCPD